jgi:hypothetical protein
VGINILEEHTAIAFRAEGRSVSKRMVYTRLREELGQEKLSIKAEK